MKSIHIFYLGNFLVLCLITASSLYFYSPILSLGLKLRSVSMELVRSKSRGKENISEIPSIYRGSCKVSTIDLLKDYSSTNQFPNGIPKVIHYVTTEEEISKDYKQRYKSCEATNRDMRVVLWTDISFYKVFVTEFNDEVVDKWKFMFSQIDGNFKTTMIKAMVLFVFGGVSLSLDTKCQKPLINSMGSERCVLNVGSPIQTNIVWNKENQFGESVFACVAKHPFLRTLIEDQKVFEKDEFYLTNYYLHYIKVNNRHGVSTFLPGIVGHLLPKPQMDELCKKNTSKSLQSKGCQMLKTYNISETSKAVLVYEPVNKASDLQIVSEDICSLGMLVHIIIT